MEIDKETLYRAIDSQPELVGATFTDRVWKLIKALNAQAVRQNKKTAEKTD